MKRLNNFLSGLTLVLLGLGWAGCRSPEIVVPLSNGYEEVARPARFSRAEPGLTRVALKYRGKDGQTRLIWPSLYGANSVIKGDLALFVGDKSYAEPDGKGTHARLFAVTSPELPLDITDEVLWRWSKTSGKDLAKTLERYSLVTPVETNGCLALHLEFYSDDKDWPDAADLTLDWNQVAEILRAVKLKGVLEKDLNWHTPYIGEQF
jgi:hypothetical protein